MENQWEPGLCNAEPRTDNSVSQPNSTPQPVAQTGAAAKNRQQKVEGHSGSDVSTRTMQRER